MPTTLRCTRPLAEYRDSEGGTLGLRLAGAHQEQNASLAVALAAAWEASPRGGGALTLPSAAAGVRDQNLHIYPKMFFRSLHKKTQDFVNLLYYLIYLLIHCYRNALKAS